MSAYKKITTQFKNRCSLLAALKDVFGAGEVKTSATNDILLRNDYGHGYQRVCIAIDRQTVSSVAGHSYGGLGYILEGAQFAQVVDDLSANDPQYKRMLDQIAQKYAYNEIVRQAAMQGYTVEKQPAADGVIRLKLVQS